MSTVGTHQLLNASFPNRILDILCLMFSIPTDIVRWVWENFISGINNFLCETYTLLEGEQVRHSTHLNRWHNKIIGRL